MNFTVAPGSFRFTTYGGFSDFTVGLDGQMHIEASGAATDYRYLDESGTRLNITGYGLNLGISGFGNQQVDFWGDYVGGYFQGWNGATASCVCLNLIPGHYGFFPLDGRAGTFFFLNRDDTINIPVEPVAFTAQAKGSACTSGGC